MSDLQKAYEKMRAHLIEQGRPAVDAMTGSCFYRHESGLKCAVGCLIDDAAYSGSLEDLTSKNEEIHRALESSGWTFDEAGFRFLFEAQLIHDQWKAGSDDGLRYVIEQLDKSAGLFGLEAVK